MGKIKQLKVPIKASKNESKKISNFKKKSKAKNKINKDTIISASETTIG